MREGGARWEKWLGSWVAGTTLVSRVGERGVQAGGGQVLKGLESQV